MDNGKKLHLFRKAPNYNNIRMKIVPTIVCYRPTYVPADAVGKFRKQESLKQAMNDRDRHSFSFPIFKRQLGSRAIGNYCAVSPLVLHEALC
jgi:hypothetical protein